jgi:hypothetical protein
MSIFIAMPTMHDTELLPTVFDAFENAKSHDIHFGIRFLSSSPEEEKKLSTLISTFGGNIKGYFDYINEHNRLDKIGTGKARKGVSELYDGQDFVLSIDSHTKFSEGWDEKLAWLYADASKLTGNKKSIITAYPSKYTYKNEERVFLDKKNLYPYIGWEEEWDLELYPFLAQPIWQYCLPWMVKDTVEDDRNLLPTGKFSYNFSFSGENFLYDEDPEMLMMEEDMCKTFKLFNDGWELVYPNTQPIVGHMYNTEISSEGGGRAYWHHFVSPEEKDMLEQKEMQNFVRYYEDPKLQETIKRYEKWMNVDFKEKSLHNYHVPLDWFHNDI